jgi:hypothetical protein
MKATLPERPTEVAHDRQINGLEPPSPAPPHGDRRTPRLRAYCLLAFAVLLEVVLILPLVDHLADTNPTIHFTQHGFIFLGGVLIGFAIREIYGTSRS